MRHLLLASFAGVLGLVTVVDVGTSGAIVGGLAATAMLTGLVVPRARSAARAAD